MLMWNKLRSVAAAPTRLAQVIFEVYQPRPFFLNGCPGFSSDPATFDGSTCVTTPPLVKGSTFTVNFPVAGNFKLTCLIHSRMTGTIHVFGPSQHLPHGQAFYDTRA